MTFSDLLQTALVISLIQSAVLLLVHFINSDDDRFTVQNTLYIIVHTVLIAVLITVLIAINVAESPTNPFIIQGQYK